jgi:hypothetical protein
MHRFQAQPARRRWRLSPVARVRLAGEIVRTYCRVRYLLWRHDEFPDAVGQLRKTQRRLKPHEGRSELEAGFGLGNAVVKTLTVLPTDSRCLMRSLVLMSVLSRRGIESQLVIGVRSAGDEFAAHAWIEYEGKALLPPGEDFARLTEL